MLCEQRILITLLHGSAARVLTATDLVNGTRPFSTTPQNRLSLTDCQSQVITSTTYTAVQYLAEIKQWGASGK